MIISDLFQPFQYLDVPDDIVELVRYVRENCVDTKSARSLVSQIETKVGLPFTDKLPFYYILLAYVYHATPEWFKAKDYAERAEKQFLRTDQKRNHAICNWFLGLLLCVYEHLDNAETKIGEARKTIQSLQKNINQLGEYEIPANKYKYSDIDQSVYDSYTRLKNQVVKQLAFKQNGLALECHFFSRTIAHLSVPEELEYLENWIQDILAPDLSKIPPDDSFFVENLFHRLDKIREETTESAMINILLTHRFNLGYYMKDQRGVEAEDFAQQAVGLFQEESINWYLSNAYLSLLRYNDNAQGTGRVNLDDAYWWLDRAQKDYERNGFIDNCRRIQNLQNDLLDWIFPFKFEQAEQRESRSSRWRIGNLIELRNQARRSPQIDLASKKPPQTTPEPEATPPVSFRRNETSSSFPRLTVGNRGQTSDRRQPPETPRTPPPHDKNVEGENEPDVQLIVVPVDMKALEKTQINDSPASDALFEKLAIYDEEYYRRKGGGHQPVAGQKAPSRQRIVIPSFPIRGSATASPKGEADLPSADGSLPIIAPEVDETLILNIHNHSYLVHLLSGAKEIHGNSQTHDWFQVDGDSMNLAEPTPIENQDYVLFDKRNCSLRACDGKIVLVSVRDVNIDPTRLMVKRFVVVSPKRYPGINDTTYLLLSESRSKYKAIEFTDEHKIEGEVVAIAKLLQ